LKDDILQPQPHTKPVTIAPEVIPPSITTFLSQSFNISVDTVDHLWEIMKDLVWTLLSAAEEQADEEASFKIHGHPLGLTARVLYPPVKTCINPECTAWQLGSLLKKEEQRRVVVFTHASGAHPAWSIHLKCRACNTNYHHNYSVKNKTCTYYGGIPSHIQVTEHQFVKLELAMQWIDLMQIVVSAMNCACLYEITQTCSSIERNESWQFLSSLTMREVWDAFVIVSLLDHQQTQRGQLQVPHDGDQKDHYTAAMCACTKQIMTHGQEELPHACYGCMQVYTSPDGTLQSTEVIVTDGVTVGRPCCAIPRCKNPLTTNHRRYCLEHQNLESVCAVEGCGQAVTSDPKTGKLQKACNDPVHVKMEAANTESSHSGKSRTQRNKIVKLNDAMESSMHDLIDKVESIPLQDTNEWYEHEIATGAVHLVQASVTTSTGVSDLAPNEPSNHDNGVPACSGKDAPVKLKAVFHRQCTNNEQLIVRPCGIISGRGTMYHHEAISNVLILVEKIFSLPHAQKLQHMIYDSNCNVLREVESRNIKFFCGMGMCVDAFHHRTKHKASDTFCREWCDMRAYPELLDTNGKFYFNSSIAEQTNVWFGSFHNICWEMTPVKYDFFLDEMILRCNCVTIATLHAQGKYPHHPHTSH
ncbi:hypothetical protein C8R48DRAFT_593873, partial [Suillus tomentosus]